MVTNVRGVREHMSPKTSLAVARNLAQSSAFMQRVEETTRARLKPFNGQGVSKFSQMAMANLEKLRVSRDEARSVLGRVEGREKSGELNALTAFAESVGPQVVVEMTEFLDQLFEKALEAKDSFALTRVFAASGCLNGYVQDKLLKEQSYPGDRAVSEGMAAGSVRLAATTYKNTVNALCAVHVELGLELPGFPDAPTMH
jgi:hypothetical protein